MLFDDDNGLLISGYSWCDLLIQELAKPRGHVDPALSRFLTLLYGFVMLTVGDSYY